jgi:hypothetical protein
METSCYCFQEKVLKNYFANGGNFQDFIFKIVVFLSISNRIRKVAFGCFWKRLTNRKKD